MTKTLTTLMIALLVVALAVPALAWGQGWGRDGRVMGPGSGPGGRWATGEYDKKFWDDTATLREEIRDKHREMRDLLTSGSVDAAKVKTLQAQINKLHNEMADKRLEYELEIKRNNPDYKPGYGPGYGRERGSGWRGAGPCWN